MKIHHLKRFPLSKLNTFDQNFMKLCHIVKYHDVFFKFDNGPYRTMPSVVKAAYSVTMNIFRKKFFLFKSFAKVE